ncbi:S9 family peptidase [Tunturibacter empetritectus]|uniref:S9 family peptidase n=1 Tax=Tunturiibacter empetritectus TaxID=3069691 RepID=A0AAU7ZH20_9BACT
MKKCAVRAGVLALSGVLALAVVGIWGWSGGTMLAQGFGPDSDSLPGSAAGRRPMTFADLQRMKRVSDPQVSPSGKWVMFSATDVDLEKNTKVNHLWVVPMAAPAAASGKSEGAGVLAKERQVTFWKDGESGGRFSPDGRQVAFVATESTTGLSQIFLAAWDDAMGTLGTPKRLTNVSTEADGPVWSPNSQRILFASRVYPECSDEASWVDEDLCNKKKDDAAAASPVKAQVFEHLLYRHWNSYLGPKRSHVLVVSAADGNAIRDLTPRRDIGEAESPTFTLGGPLGYAWAPGSEEIAYVTNVDLVRAASTNNDVFTLLLDDANAKPRRISTSFGSDDGPSYSPDGKYIAFRSQERAGYESDRFRLVTYDRLAHKLQTLDMMLLEREPPTIVIAGAKPSQNLPPPVIKPERDVDRWVDEFIWSSDSQRIFFTAGDQGQQVIYGVNATGGNLHRYGKYAGAKTVGEWSDLVQVGPGYRLAGVLMRADKPAELAIANMSEMDDSGFINMPVVSKSPSAMKMYNLREGVALATPNFLTHLNDHLVEALDLEPLEPFWFTGAEGTKVQGFVIRPPKFDASRKYPLKFLIHGGPQGAWGDMWSYRWNAELMAASGYVVVMVNPRGSTGYGQAFIDGVNGDWGGKAYVDLMKGLDYAEAHYSFIDKRRECALGASYGGFMANWILTHTNRFACIVTHDGMFNPESAYGTTEELWFNEWEFRRPEEIAPGQPWRYAAGPVANDPFRRWSPMLAIENAKTPTLVIHSQRDYRLDVSEGFQLFTALQRLNVPSRMLYFPDEGHWVLKPQNSKLWYETVGEWCDRWTKTNLYADLVPDTEAPVAPTKGKGATRTTTAPANPTTHSAPVAAGPGVEDLPQRAVGSEDFTVAIGAPQDEVKAGTDAKVTIALRNVSNHQIAFAHKPGANNPEFSYRIEVKDAKGHEVEGTAYGREALQHQQEETRMVEYVQPGKAAVQTAHLERLVNMNRPGRYTVVVFRKDAKNGAVVRSNELTMNVVP